jgi:hypothetical protein
VIALAEATTDALGHPAGLESKTTAVHAFCNLVNRTGQLLGQIHLDSRDVCFLGVRRRSNELNEQTAGSPIRWVAVGISRPTHPLGYEQTN